MDKIEILKILTEANRGKSPLEIEIVATALQQYLYAKKNIEDNGTIVFHPRTGAPIENPYLKIYASALKTIRQYKKIRPGNIC